MLKLIRKISRCQEGATAIEYGLIAALIAIAMIAAFQNVAGTTTGMWNNVSNEYNDASNKYN
jgi:pilus assembly protein Flp/PilA